MGKNILKLDTSGFARELRRIESLGGNVKGAVEEMLTKASQKISTDTEAALDKPNLPAQGKYPTGTTKESIIRDHRVRWEGEVGWVPVGFDFSKPGAGGYLITGTPKMQPDMALNKMYKQKSYMKQIQKDMWEIAWDHILKLSGG